MISKIRKIYKFQKNYVDISSNKIFCYCKMITSDTFKTNIIAKQKLTLPVTPNTITIQNKGSLIYNDPSANLFYSNGQQWIEIFSSNNQNNILTPKNFITVHPTFSGADFTNIKDALAFATSLLPTVSAVMVYPSVYMEDNPLVVPNTISVIGISGPFGSTVLAANAGSPLFSIGNGCLIQDLSISGGSIGINYDGSTGSKSGSIVRGVIIIDSIIGVQSFVGPGELFCVNTLVRSNTGTVTTGFNCISGGKMRCFTSGVFGLPLNRVGTGVFCSGLGSLLVYFSSGFQLCTDTVKVDDNARLEIKSSFIRDSNRGLTIDSTGTSTLLVTDATIMNSLLYDLDIQALSADVQIYGGQLRVDLINNPNNITIFSSAFSNQPYNQSLQILGDLHVGTHLQASDSSIGQGDSYVNGMVVLTDNGTGTNFINITSSAKDRNVTTAFLQGLTVGNVIYIGSDAVYYGLDIKVTVNWSVGDSDKIAKEYWNGVTWVNLSIMTTKASPPYPSRTDLMLEIIEEQRINFGKTTGFSITSVNGIAAYWTRYRVTALLTGPVATFNSLELHPSSTKINNDGFIEYFGNARPIKLIHWDLGQLEPASSSPADQDVFISDNLDIGKQENLFANSATDRSGFNTYLPREIDTSYGAKFRWSYRSTATGGSINWVIRWGWTNDNFDVYTSTATAPAVGVNEQSSSFSTPVVAPIGRQITQTFTLSIPKVNARPLTGNPDMLWITLQRTVGDTHTGDVALIQVQGEYVAFCEGGHVSEF